jgi:uncharacterized protein
VKIPYEELSGEVLNAIIEEFVLREGTDYGPREYTLEAKVTQIKAQLERGEAKIVFDPELESINVVLGNEAE